jgi:hypothetical protein
VDRSSHHGAQRRNWQHVAGVFDQTEGMAGTSRWNARHVSRVPGGVEVPAAVVAPGLSEHQQVLEEIASLRVELGLLRSNE